MRDGYRVCRASRQPSGCPKIEPKPSARLIPRSRASTLKHEDRVRLDQCAARKRRDADHCARRIRLVEVSGHDLVDAGEMRQIGQIDAELDRIGERSATSLCPGFQGSEKTGDLVLYSLA